MCNCSPKQTSNPCGCVEKPKGCAVKDLSTDCIIYKNTDLNCIGVTTDTILTDVLKSIDEAICNIETGNTDLINVGGGAQVYKGDNVQGQKELRTLVSASTDLTITQNTDTITLTLAAKGADIYTVSGILNSTTGAATFTRTDATTYSVDLSPLLQVQANVLETNTAAKGFIQNKNPTKVIATSYTLTALDNNYVILISNGTTPITITIPTGLGSNYFVGFIQQGTADVTFAGFDLKPLDMSATIYGQGHNAAVEVISGTRYLFGNLRAS